MLTEYIVARAINKLNETVTDNVGVLYNKDDDNSSFDVSPLVLDDSTRSKMVIYAVNTSTATNPAAPFTEERLGVIRNLFDNIPTYNITLRNARQDTLDYLDIRGAHLTLIFLKNFLSFVAGFSVVIVTKVETIEDSNHFLRPYLPATNFSILPEGWQYVKMILLAKSFYHTGDVDSAAVAVSHHCKLLNVHQLLALVEPLRRQDRPTNTANFISRQNEAPTTLAGYKALMTNMIADSNSWQGLKKFLLILMGHYKLVLLSEDG